MKFQYAVALVLALFLGAAHGCPFDLVALEADCDGELVGFDGVNPGVFPVHGQHGWGLLLGNLRTHDPYAYSFVDVVLDFTGSSVHIHGLVQGGILAGNVIVGTEECVLDFWYPEVVPQGANLVAVGGDAEGTLDCSGANGDGGLFTLTDRDLGGTQALFELKYGEWRVHGWLNHDGPYPGRYNDYAFCIAPRCETEPEEPEGPEGPECPEDRLFDPTVFGIYHAHDTFEDFRNPQQGIILKSFLSDGPTYLFSVNDLFVDWFGESGYAIFGSLTGGKATTDADGNYSIVQDIACDIQYQALLGAFNLNTWNFEYSLAQGFMVCVDPISGDVLDFNLEGQANEDGVVSIVTEDGCVQGWLDIFDAVTGFEIVEAHPRDFNNFKIYCLDDSLF